VRSGFEIFHGGALRSGRPVEATGHDKKRAARPLTVRFVRAPGDDNGNARIRQHRSRSSHSALYDFSFVKSGGGKVAFGLIRNRPQAIRPFADPKHSRIVIVAPGNDAHAFSRLIRATLPEMYGEFSDPSCNRTTRIDARAVRAAPPPKTTRRSDRTSVTLRRTAVLVTADARSDRSLRFAAVRIANFAFTKDERCPMSPRC
jgi:hypothetical protein